MDALFSHVTFVANNKVTPVPYTLFATVRLSCLYYELSYDDVVSCVLCTYDNSTCYVVVCNGIAITTVFLQQCDKYSCHIVSSIRIEMKFNVSMYSSSIS